MAEPINYSKLQAMLKKTHDETKVNQKKLRRMST